LLVWTVVVAGLIRAKPWKENVLVSMSWGFEVGFVLSC